MTRKLSTALPLLLAAACAVRLGGPKPEIYRTLAFAPAAGSTPAQVAEQIRRADARVVLLAAQADTAWFDELARQTGLQLSGPGRAGPVSLAFLAGKAEGDTTLTLQVEGGPGLVLQDALYQIAKNRFLDLMAFRLEPTAPLRETVRAFLAYVATDVMPNAAVALAVHVPETARGDSLASLLRPAFLDARDCTDKPAAPAPAPAPTPVRFFFGPEVRVRCQKAQTTDLPGSPIVAELMM